MRACVRACMHKLKSNELMSVFENNSIICMTEVTGDPSQNFEVEDVSHFELHRTERKQSCTRNSGGIIIYVRNNLVSEETLFAKRDDTHIWLRLKHKLFNFDNDLFLCLYYIPPSSSSRQIKIRNEIL